MKAKPEATIGLANLSVFTLKYTQAFTYSGYKVWLKIRGTVPWEVYGTAQQIFL